MQINLFQWSVLKNATKCWTLVNVQQPGPYFHDWHCLLSMVDWQKNKERPLKDNKQGLNDFLRRNILCISFRIPPPKKTSFNDGEVDVISRHTLFNMQFSPLYLDCISKIFFWFLSFCTEGLQKKKEKNGTQSVLSFEKAMLYSRFYPFSLELKGQKHTNHLEGNTHERARAHTRTHTELSFIEESRHLALSICTEAGPVSLSGAQWSCSKAEATCSRLCQNLIRLKRSTARHWLEDSTNLKELIASLKPLEPRDFEWLCFSFAVIIYSHELYNFYIGDCLKISRQL